MATEALKWLQANAGQLRNERIAPLAEKSREIWAALRQESNVDLGAIRLEGQKTSRRVVLQAAVDGSETEAFGVMSQGELQALALAIFIPRATSPESPFRFLVFDDPIQAMDPSKIDGFLEVLTALAKDRQVIVLTHDDRLPAAIRGSRAPARIVEVTRAANSAISVVESTRPATRLLDDAFAIAADDAVPEDIKRSAIPALCREALEATAWDVYSSKALADGRSREDIEDAWESATKTAKRLALALAVNADDAVAVDKWKAGGRARRDTLTVVNKGIHQGVSDYKSAVNDARLAIGDLARAPHDWTRRTARLCRRGPRRNGSLSDPGRHGPRRCWRASRLRTGLTSRAHPGARPARSRRRRIRNSLCWAGIGEQMWGSGPGGCGTR